MPGLTTPGLRIPKTIKLYIGGAFARTESGRSFPVYKHGTDEVYAHLCQASRKDFRNAVGAAQKAQSGWNKKTAYNRGQILYRMAEMAESHKASFMNIMRATLGYNEKKSEAAFNGMIDAFVYYAGFTDKYQQIMGAMNPVSSPHHNFTTTDAMGVVAHICREDMELPELATQIAATICSGNTLVTLMGPAHAALMAPLSETIATSDVPGGVINLLCGFESELYTHIGGHMEVQAINYQGSDSKTLTELRQKGADNMKRIFTGKQKDLSIENILNFVEYKTVWHPIGV